MVVLASFPGLLVACSMKIGVIKAGREGLGTRLWLYHIVRTWWASLGLTSVTGVAPS